MATRFSGDATAYTATSALPGPSGYTVAFWLKMSVDRAADQVFWGAQNMLDMAHLYWGCDSARVMTLADDSATYITSSVGALTVGTWYKVAFTWTSATGFTLYVGANGSALTADSGTLGSAPTSLFKIWLGASRYTGSWWNGCFQNYRQWSATLTASELEAEFASPVALRTTNLVRSHNLVLPPALASTTVPDEANSNSLTTGTTVAAYEQAAMARQTSTALLYATSAAALTGTWTNASNATGSTTATYATWVSSTASATAALELTYDLAGAGVPANALINGVYMQFRGFVSSTTLLTDCSVTGSAAATAESPAGTSVLVGSSGSLARSTAVAERPQITTGLQTQKLVSVSSFKLASRFTKSATASSSTASVDRLGIVVDWTSDEEPGRTFMSA